jgi:formylglycine-generating enzyme required for sulfatase activity
MNKPVTANNKLSHLNASIEVANKLLARKANPYNMVFVEGGTFMMGCTTEQVEDCREVEKPVHQVILGDFYIGEYPVTQEEWVAVMVHNPSYYKGARRPVDSVSWNDAQVFLRRLNEKTGSYYRLPTEAEWEYAARGGKLSKGYKYSGANDLGAVAQCNDEDKSDTFDVGLKQPNELGLYDLSGNVSEWCSDWYAFYTSGASNNPIGPYSGQHRVCRGGGVRFDPRVSYRGACPPECNRVRHGLRLAAPPF